jgi:hypothetical protein
LLRRDLARAIFGFLLLAAVPAATGESSKPSVAISRRTSAASPAQRFILLMKS